MLIRETTLVKDHYMIGKSNWYEPFTTNKGELFRSCRKEFGRCVSKVYRDVFMGDGTIDSRACGWVFEKRCSDHEGEWTQETWVEVKHG